jgi:putative tryptophan/tyrosine transport system substrate-binding protein
MGQGNRRRFLIAGTALLAAPLARAQEAGRRYRMGILSVGEYTPNLGDPFFGSLREQGFVLHDNLTVLYRHSKGGAAGYPALAEDLVKSKVDIIVAAHSPAAHAAKNATRTIPIVMGPAVANPERQGLVASLARPGGNVTGMTQAGAEFSVKVLELMREALPRLNRVAIFHNPGNSGSALALREAQLPAAAALKLPVVAVGVREAADVEPAFQEALSQGADAIFCQLAMWEHRDAINELAAKHRLPTAVTSALWASEGALLSYGTDLEDVWRRVGVYVAKVLKGTPPADLPVEGPTKFELVVNLKTARALGIAIPPAVLLRADRVIE